MSDTFSVPITVRYQDIDTQDHVNNSVFVTYIQEARIQYLQSVIGESVLDPDHDVAFVIASLSMSFERPVTLGDDLVVTVEVTEIGTTSAQMSYELALEDGMVATAETTLVFVDSETETPVPVPETYRSAITSFEGFDATDES